MFEHKAGFSQAWSGGFMNHYRQKGESSARTDRTDLIRAPWLLHDVNREKVNQADSSGFKGGSKIIGWTGKKKYACWHKRNPTKAKNEQTMKTTWK